MVDPTNNMIVWLALIPLLAGLACVPMVNFPRVCRGVGVLGFGATLALAVSLLVAQGETSGGVFVSQMGGWAAPYGITLVFDALSGLMVAAASLVALGTYVFAFGSLPARTERRYFHPLVCFMMLGVNLSFLTGDLFNLFVAFEIMLMASYGLLVIGGGRAQLRQAYKYVVMNLLASSVFVIAAGMAYGMFGTLNMADLGRLAGEQAAAGTLPAGFTALGVLFLFVFALKAGVFPLWFWLPDTYPTLPTAIAGLFGGVLTKVGLYAIARTFSLIFIQPGADGEAGFNILVVILGVGAGMTMLVGVLGALAYTGLRRVLCLMLVVGVGYSLLGIATMTGGSLEGAAFYMAQSMLVMAGLFLCGGLIERAGGGTDEASATAGLLQKPGQVWLSVLFFAGLMAVVGLPPTSGFYGKLVVLREALGGSLWGVGVVGLLVGALTLLAALRVWSTTFWGPPPEAPPEAPPEVSPEVSQATASGDARRGPRVSEVVGVVVLVGASLGLGFVPGPAIGAAGVAGRQLAEPEPYFRAVLDNPRYAAGDSSKKSYQAAGTGDDHHEGDEH